MAVSADLTDISATVSNYPSTLHFMVAKTVHENNILVGSDPVQIRFIEQQIGLSSKRVERVSDEMLLGSAGLLLLVSAGYQIDLSPEVKKRTGVWSVTEVKKGSAAINALVELAHTLAPIAKGVKFKRPIINLIGDQVTKNPVYDIRSALWQAVWSLGLPPDEGKVWPEPWDVPVGWMPKGVDPGKRLHVLYRTLISYVLIKTKTPEIVRAFGVTPSKQNWLNSLSLDGTKVYKAILILSNWRKEQSPPYICALKISALWN